MGKRAFTLSEMSRNNLDKIQQGAVTAGDGVDHCICSYICGRLCGCFGGPVEDLLEVADAITEAEAVVQAKSEKWINV